MGSYTIVESEMRDQNPLSISIIQAIAEKEGKNPGELDFVLHDYIDPDIFGKLQSNGPRKWSLKFEVGSHYVSVNQDERILVDGRANID